MAAYPRARHRSDVSPFFQADPHGRGEASGVCTFLLTNLIVLLERILIPYRRYSNVKRKLNALFAVLGVRYDSDQQVLSP
jgi:hypothetical protein